MRISRTHFATLAAALVAVALPLGAARADDDRLDNAWEDAVADQEAILTEKQFALLNNLAFEIAATKVCDGFAVDVDKVAKAFEEATTPPPKDDMTPEEAGQWHTAVVFRLGTTYGLFLAEGNAKPDDFCASATESKADMATPNIWK